MLNLFILCILNVKTNDFYKFYKTFTAFDGRQLAEKNKIYIKVFS